MEASKLEPNREVLNFVLEATLKITHPFAPFVTETIWRNCGHDSLLAAELWPKMPEFDKTKAQQFEEVKNIISEVRRIAIAVGADKPALYYQNVQLVAENKALISRLGRLGEIKEGSGGLRLPGVKQDVWLDIDAKAYLDKLREAQKTREVAIKLLEARLANKSYIDNAPEELVEETRSQLETEKTQLAKIEEDLKTFTQTTP